MKSSEGDTISKGIAPSLAWEVHGKCASAVLGGASTVLGGASAVLARRVRCEKVFQRRA